MFVQPPRNENRIPLKVEAMVVVELERHSTVHGGGGVSTAGSSFRYLKAMRHAHTGAQRHASCQVSIIGGL